MVLEDNKLYQFYNKNKKGIQVIEGVLIVILLIVLNSLAYINSNLNEEIRENCGWGEEDYYCYCEMGAVQNLKLQAEQEAGADIIISDDVINNIGDGNVDS